MASVPVKGVEDINGIGHSRPASVTWIGSLPSGMQTIAVQVNPIASATCGIECAQLVIIEFLEH
ncbi:MAG: hypothetical protein ACTSYZ_09025 [Candidatus Helarchaeota archaeon]